MLVISTREFRENLKSYLDKADQGVEILIHRSGKKSYKLVPVENEETLMSKEEFFAKTDKSIQEVKEDKVYKKRTNENLEQFIDRLQAENKLKIPLIFQKGIEVFGDENKFNRWLEEENKALGGKKPKDLLDNTFGISLIENELVKIEHGIFA